LEQYGVAVPDKLLFESAQRINTLNRLESHPLADYVLRVYVLRRGKKFTYEELRGNSTSGEPVTDPKPQEPVLGALPFAKDNGRSPGRNAVCGVAKAV
jgi:hypothetical protein